MITENQTAKIHNIRLPRQQISQNYNHPQHHRHRIILHDPRLPAPQHGSDAAEKFGRAVHGAVDNLHVENFPEEIFREPHQRAHEQRVVNFIDIILALDYMFYITPALF